MATKTWKLGEVCRGGIITVETKDKVVTIIGKDWDFSQGTKRGSNQSGAKEWTRETIDINEEGSVRKMSNFLNDLTTSYHTDKIIEWIESKSKVDISSAFHW